MGTFWKGIIWIKLALGVCLMTEPTTPHLGQQYGFSGYDSKPEKTLEGTPCTSSSESASV